AEQGLDRRRGVAAGPVDEAEAAVRPVEEDGADVAAGIAAVLAALRVDLAEFVERAAGEGDRVAQRREVLGRAQDAVVDGAAVVLDLLEREEVWRAEVASDLVG